MFARVLFDDADMCMFVNWLGLGSVVILAKSELRPKVRCTKAQERFLFEAAAELNRMGFPSAPDDPATGRMLREFAKAAYLERPNSLTWQTLFHVGPQKWARGEA